MFCQLADVESFNWFGWLVVPMLIFCARIVDVSIGTLRLVCVARGMKKIAPVIGFFEVLTWLLAMSAIMKNLNNPVTYIAYAGGFATGNYVGMCIAEKLAMGKVVVRVLTNADTTALIDSLREHGFGVTKMQGMGATGQVDIVFTVASKSAVPDIIALVNKNNPRAFYSISEAGNVNEGIFPAGKSNYLSLQSFMRPMRLGK
ncbi:MAG: DUF2179 domain-containing protein [Phycisphaerae bacterium]|jgi:uncharacterized protein YebE (UPF0316 family)